LTSERDFVCISHVQKVNGPSSPTSTESENIVTIEKYFFVSFLFVAIYKTGVRQQRLLITHIGSREVCDDRILDETGISSPYSTTRLDASSATLARKGADRTDLRQLLGCKQIYATLNEDFECSNFARILCKQWIATIVGIN